MTNKIKNFGEQFIDWLINLFTRRIFLIAVSIFGAWMFKSPPYKIIGSDGQEFTILSSFEPNAIIFKMFMWVAVLEFFGLTWFGDKIINNFRDGCRIRKISKNLINKIG